MFERIKKLLLEGKSMESILEILAVEFKDIANDEIIVALENAQKAVSLEGSMAKSVAAKAADAELEAKVSEKVDAALKNIPTESILDTLRKEKSISVSENPEAWKKDCADMVVAFVDSGKSVKAMETAEKLAQKNFKRYQEKTMTGVISETDNVGGYFMAPEFDMEVDKLVYQSSELLNRVQIRMGGEKTEINSIGTIDFSIRADQTATFNETRPSFDQMELKYRDAGAIVGISNAALRGSAYNLISELTQNAADARIRFLEPYIVSTSVDVDGDAFDGIRLYTGITTLDCINANANGKIVSKDCTRLYLAAPAQSRGQGVFVMDSRELMILLEEEGTGSGLYKNAVSQVNGKFIHNATGKEIIVSDLQYRTINGVTDRSTGTDVPVIFGDLKRFRIYQDGGMRVDTSTQVYWKEDGIGIRFIQRFKSGIPTYSRSSFVSLQKVKSVSVS